MATPDNRAELLPGARVKITQQIAARDYSLATEVCGTILSYQQRPTGSWFAHAKADRLWLDRLVLRKDDGEVTTLNLDEFTDIKILPPAPVAATPEA